MANLWMLEPWVLAAYAGCMVMILAYTCGQIHLMWISRRRGKTPSEAVPALPEVLPFVTVQLPVYNERQVVERLLRAVGRLRYPADRFEVQLLDDSDDETTEIAGRCLGELARRGIRVSHVRRRDRLGFKAGALAHGMESARGAFVAIFDADFVPRRDFLRRTLGYFRDEKVAAVQARWGYLNQGESLLTRLQAFLLSLHFGFEQPRRDRAGLFLNFNGTCGVWRREAIEDAGGWMARTITEDIDLSYRAQMRGWKIRYLDGYTCPGELPQEISGFRTQQYRWMKGGAQNAALHLGAMLTGPRPARVRGHAALHLLSGSVYLLIFVALLLSTPLALLKNRAIAYDYADFGLPFLAGTAGLFWVFHAAQRPRPRGLVQTLQFTGMMILFLVLTLGLSVHNGLAVLSGWLGRESPFVRTPKNGSEHWSISPYTKRRFDPRVVRDLLMLGYLALGLYGGWLRGEFAFWPLQAMACAGLAWVTTLSLVHPLRAARSARRNLAALAAARARAGEVHPNVSTEVIA